MTDEQIKRLARSFRRELNRTRIVLDPKILDRIMPSRRCCPHCGLPQ